ncbi:RNA-binding S4 domain protein [Methylobacterium sp. 4-46]|nr:RNA-binding S4 domain protein [Methylobacterium sp. 4-46]
MARRRGEHDRRPEQVQGGAALRPVRHLDATGRDGGDPPRLRPLAGGAPFRRPAPVVDQRAAPGSVDQHAEERQGRARVGHPERVLPAAQRGPGPAPGVEERLPQRPAAAAGAGAGARGRTGRGRGRGRGIDRPQPGSQGDGRREGQDGARDGAALGRQPAQGGEARAHRAPPWGGGAPP